MGKVKKFFSDFKAFITRGNIIDMAVGVIIGGAFSAIINALVNAVLMPLITTAIPGGLEGFVTVLNHNAALPTEKTVNTVSYWGITYDKDVVNVMNWGTLINAIINFIIIGFILFIILRVVMNAKANMEHSKELADAFTKEERKAMRAEGKSFKEINKLAEEKIAAEKAEKARLEAEAKANAVTEITLLTDIKALLEKQQSK
ncbi:MAG: large conductance mechanosensitive channel protein MscL [Bacilli bacterium]|jgi:large conductance mechanosensitive channel|nr:large conductance mechanosensitive channel protein MscL [Bacilli bacterium]